MKKTFFLISLLGIIGFLGACASKASAPLIQPAEGKPTFVFFYTDN